MDFFGILATLMNECFHTLLTHFGSTQNFTLTKDELGVTRVQDISSQDMEKVRSLSLIELTALFDSHGLALHRRKPVKRRVKGKLHQVGTILTALPCVLYTVCMLKVCKLHCTLYLVTGQNIQSVNFYIRRILLKFPDLC